MKIKSIFLVTTLLIVSVTVYARTRVEPTGVQGRRPTAGPQITLKLGQSITANDGLKATFVSMDGDSRCPIGVNAIWAGNARVTIQLSKGDGAPATVELNTNSQPLVRKSTSATTSAWPICFLTLKTVPPSTKTPT